MNLTQLAKKKTVIFDGGMGTNLALARKSEVKNPKSEVVCSEAYNIYEPDLVLSVHSSFINAGCDVIETNAFNANRISLAEFGLDEKVAEINRAAVAIAKKARGKKRVLISGNVGPTNKLPSLGQAAFDDLYAAYFEQITHLAAAGVDQIQIETCQDIMQAKVAVIAANDVFEKLKKRLPIILSVVVDGSGKMLLGTEMEAVLATFTPLRVDVIGLNCGVGPAGMESAARYLANHSPLPILLMPNAGFPEIVDGETRYSLSPEDFAEQLTYYVRELGVEMVGGCCGATPEHIGALAVSVGLLELKRSEVRSPKSEVRKWASSLSSLFCATAIKQEPRPLIVGERMNVNGSKRFKEFILSADYDSAALVAKEQEDGGAHAIDISVSYAGGDEPEDFRRLLGKTVSKTNLPIFIDSTNIASIEAALKSIPGRPVINSINLEDGGTKARAILQLVKRFGAAVVALTIDEDGMAKEAEKKEEIAGRLVELSADFGIDIESLFIDPLTFTLAEPRAAAFGSGKETLKAIRMIKERFPTAAVCLGISNISYGFKKSARRVLNSVFLYEALLSGLDAAIVHAGQIIPLQDIDAETIEITRDLIFNRREDALKRFIGYFERKEIDFVETSAGVSPEGGARLSIIKGDKIRIIDFLEELIANVSAKVILEEILLPAMGEVGELFDRGKIPLPFVLQSAEAMKTATDWLARYFGEGEQTKKGKVVLATVRGDVHDIGKNLVDIVLTNNGFDVINLGVKQPLENILKAWEESDADVIGLSGLLVESALVMKDDLAEMKHRGISVPVVCGGAALTKKFVEGELATVYGGPVFYAADAFDGLRIVKKIVGDW